jgi:type I restriction enzyme S subunit
MSNKANITIEEEAASVLVPKLRFPEFRGDKGWHNKAVGEVCKLYQSETITSSEFIPDGAHLVYGANGVVGRFNQFNHSEAEVVVSCRGNCGEVHLTQPKSWITGNAMVVSPKAEELTKEFLFRLLGAANLKPVVSGSAQPQITRQSFSPFRISIPSPTEQYRIAECLSSLDELLAAQGRKVDALKTHKKGLMQQLFPREGETQPRLRFPEFQNAGEWATRSLGQLAVYENGKAYEQDIVENGKYVVVNSRFISTNGLVRKYTNAEYLIAEAGEVLMVLSDLPKGKALAKCYFAELSNFYAVNQRVCRLRPKEVNGRFLYYALNRHPHLLAFDDGLNQTHLSKSGVNECPLCVPTCKEEQHRIAECLSSLDTRITAETQRFEALKTHKRGLMQQLFPSPEEAS